MQCMLFGLKRREAWVKAAAGTVEERALFRKNYPDWYKPAPNRYASHFFMLESSELYRNLQVSDLTMEAVEFGLLNK